MVWNQPRDLSKTVGVQSLAEASSRTARSRSTQQGRIGPLDLADAVLDSLILAVWAAALAKG
jgi:hypothetical protein